VNGKIRLCVVTLSRMPPNRRLQLTALCAREIRAFLKAEISSTVVSIYWCAAAEAQDVRRLTSSE